ncbi:MAG: class I SAM-dependent methyltransferase [Chitinophagaceae bacterium]|nr:class I SAM-dependent methyltransferase [Chitinophagaceae bacterium]
MNIQLFIDYIKYYLSSSNGKGHGVHSPFVFDFITNVLNNKKHYYTYDQVEALRQKLAEDRTTIEVEDLGAGSKHSSTNTRTIGSIARNAAKPPKFGKLLFRMVNQYQPATILEVGTSLGITTFYLASANRSANVVTLEGAEGIAKKAVQHFDQLDLQNVRLVLGNFDTTLPKVLAAMDQLDFVFLDGNHRLAPTLNYFNQVLPRMSTQSIIVVDDIYWSAEMKEAWRQIKSHNSVMLSIDLFSIGILFFNPSFKVRQDFAIRF